MAIWTQVVVLAVLAISRAVTQGISCPSQCECPGFQYMYCIEKGLSEPPSGSWPLVAQLQLQGNEISELHPNSFAGFSGVSRLQLDNNKLTELDLRVFEAMPLYYLHLQNNAIHTVTPFQDVLQRGPGIIYLSGNAISNLDPDVFTNAAPYLQQLDLSGNPLVIEDGQPILNHPTLEVLSLRGANLARLTSASIAGLPRVSILHLTNCGISEVVEGALSSSSVSHLYLSNNPLQRFDVSAVSDSANIKSISIENTPLACTCGYQTLYWWALGRVTLSATCEGQDACSFTKRGN